VIVQPRHQNGDGARGSFYWQKMSTLPEKKDQQSEENKNSNDSNTVVSSYWGITRPKVKREDGTEWPWNCFMVRIYYVEEVSKLTHA